MAARFISALFSFLAFSSLSLAQAPITVTPCDLVNAPHTYSGKLVEVRARVNLAFEDFSLAQPGCEDKYPGVWLMYGGDEPTPTMSTVNDQSRKPGSVMRVNGIPIPLVHDEALKLFRKRLGALRTGPIGDRPCYDCYLYRVTATIKGVFFAAQTPVQPFAGYGHLGCCHLLAIEQVSDVQAERTPIPMGGTFKCESETKTLDAVEAQRLNALDKPCPGVSFRQCQDLRFEEIAAAAKLWNDPLKLQDGTLNVGEIAGKTSNESWESNDKLKAYTVTIELDDPDKTESKATGGSITRETCKSTVSPLPMSAVVNCRNLWSEFRSKKDDVEVVARRVATGEESWRVGPTAGASLKALNEAAAIWGITLSREFLPVDCEKSMVIEGDQFAWCHWMAKDGMQSFSVQVTRFGYLRHGRQWASVPWVLTRGNGLVCSVEP
ncbi:MAG TPA: hypothetical protein VMT38_10540 [Terracidiphilus sp.]|nr:hypothetical protein [Terracidiphilus sp.]